MRADAGVERQGAEGLGQAVHQRRRTDGARKGDDRHVRMTRTQALGDPHHRIERPVEELFLRKHPRPGIEKLDGIGARIDLMAEMVDDRVDEEIDQQLEGFRMGIGPSLHLGEVLAAAAFDHVAGQREGSAGESQERRFLRQLRPRPADRLIDRRQVLLQARPGQAAELRGIGQRLELRTLALLEPDLLAERIGHHQDVGEDDRRVEPEPANGLQRHLDGLVGRVAEFQKRARGRAHGTVFRQVATGLSHQPDRWRRMSRSGQRLQEFSAAQISSLMLPSTLFILGSSSSRACGMWGCALLVISPQVAVDRNPSIRSVKSADSRLTGHSSQTVRRGR